LDQLKVTKWMMSMGGSVVDEMGLMGSDIVVIVVGAVVVAVVAIAVAVVVAVIVDVAVGIV